MAGYPIVLSTALLLSAAKNEVVYLFGDMRIAAASGDRRQLRMKQDESAHLSTDELAVQTTSRFGSVAHDLGDGSTAGPIVGLVANT